MYSRKSTCWLNCQAKGFAFGDVNIFFRAHRTKPDVQLSQQAGLTVGSRVRLWRSLEMLWFSVIGLTGLNFQQFQNRLDSHSPMIGLKRDKHYIGLARLHFRSSNAFYRVLLVRVSAGDDLLVFISKYSLVQGLALL